MKKFLVAVLFIPTFCFCQFNPKTHAEVYYLSYFGQQCEIGVNCDQVDPFDGIFIFEFNHIANRLIFMMKEPNTRLEILEFKIESSKVRPNHVSYRIKKDEGVWVDSVVVSTTIHPEPASSIQYVNLYRSDGVYFRYLLALFQRSYFIPKNKLE